MNSDYDKILFYTWNLALVYQHCKLQTWMFYKCYMPSFAAALYAVPDKSRKTEVKGKNNNLK